MSANRAALIDTLTKGRQKRTPLSANKTVKLRLARSDNTKDSRLQRLVDLASSLIGEAQTLARENAFDNESARLRDLDVANGVDFYSEVERFETALIKLALGQAGGSQAQAARLLGLQPTTLNSKIKLYHIEY